MAVQTIRTGARPWQLLSALLALTALVLATVLLWPSGAAEAEVEEPEVEEPEVAAEPSALTDTPEASAALACGIMAEVDPAGFEDPSTDEARAELHRLSAATLLAYTAEAEDPGFEELRQLLEAPRQVQARTFAMDGEQYTAAVEAAQAACADHLPQED